VASQPASASVSAAIESNLFFDPVSFTSYDHPYETYAQLREHRPVYFNERRNLWVISRYEDVSACLRDHEHLVNKYGNDIDGTHDAYGVGMLVCQDPPHHTVLREALRGCFTPQAIMAMEARMREVSRKLVQTLHQKGSVEFTDEIALPLAFDTALHLVGAPSSEAPYFIDHLKRSMARTVGGLGLPEDAAAANHETEVRLAEIIEERRNQLLSEGDRVSSDAITQILMSVEQGKIDDVEVIGLTHLVLSAATDAPAALLSNCVALLDRFPNLQSQLAESPEKIPNFIEEVLRFEGPAQNLSRQSVDQIEIAGTVIPSDSRVMLLLASANRDERAFPNPDLFDIDRDFGSSPKILSFGEGIHSCMGAPVARLTAKVFLEEMLDGHEYRIEGTPERWVKQMIRGYSRLPLSVVVEPDAPLVGAVAHHQNKITLTGHRHLLETRVVLTHKETKADGVVALVLESADGGEMPEWEPGAHVDVMIAGAPTRQYSLCGNPEDRNRYRIAVLRERDSRGGSHYIHDSLSVGDEFLVRGPRNNFPLQEAERYVFIAGGIGITPFLPMVSKLSSLNADWTLHYGGSRLSSMAFLDELKAYGDRVILWPKKESGRLDLEEIFADLGDGTVVYCCGPESLIDDVETLMSGWPEDALCVERFAAKPMGEPFLSTPFDVELAQSGITVRVNPDQSILDALQEAGVATVSSCKEGTCGTCETRVLAGTPDHRDSVLDKKARRQGDRMMICVSRSCSDHLTVDL
jgi:cytochrome P450/ferredoxin-NADP reductase